MLLMLQSLLLIILSFATLSNLLYLLVKYSCKIAMTLFCMSDTYVVCFRSRIDLMCSRCVLKMYFMIYCCVLYISCNGCCELFHSLKSELMTFPFTLASYCTTQFVYSLTLLTLTARLGDKDVCYTVVCSVSIS